MPEPTDSKAKPRRRIRWLWPAAAVEALVVLMGLGLIVQCHRGDVEAPKAATQPGAILKSN